MAKSSVDVDGEPAARWRARLQRFAHAGGSVSAFCAAEGVSAWSFYRWRRRLDAAQCNGTPAAAGVKPKASTAPTSGFIDAGVTRLIGTEAAAAAAPLEVRIELGGGIVLRILRG